MRRLNRPLRRLTEIKPFITNLNYDQEVCCRVSSRFQDMEFLYNCTPIKRETSRDCERYLVSTKPKQHFYILSLTAWYRGLYNRTILNSFSLLVSSNQLSSYLLTGVPPLTQPAISHSRLSSPAGRCPVQLTTICSLGT
ncbi:hypothetical protein TNCV_147371 [Trichonephila clavipes]|nr:hypothetical protein TNCV_147371 [Trichonephila clavipes]